MTHKLYINAYFIIFSRPSRSSNLTPCLHGGRCDCRYPRGLQQQKQITLLIMINAN